MLWCVNIHIYSTHTFYFGSYIYGKKQCRLFWDFVYAVCRSANTLPFFRYLKPMKIFRNLGPRPKTTFIEALGIILFSKPVTLIVGQTLLINFWWQEDVNKYCRSDSNSSKNCILYVKNLPKVEFMEIVKIFFESNDNISKS